ncbi:hypothetical protein [Actinoplanes solisilvae]|uniref:hypothetical protein n=1 Tax=Actinoplanes solisilvae TaxID=2486853 RepID=UPI000FD8C968|nr:hypothetical protein [Actinoplanes solisilvae]
MIGRRIATLVATLLAIPAVGACGSPATDARRSERAAIAPAPAAATSAVRGSTRAVAAASVRNVPAAFPLPPGSRVTDLSDRASGASFTLTAPDPQTVVDFYRRQLPLGAFTVVADRVDQGATSLSFRDAEGWAGAIFATARRVTVAVKRA